MDFEGRKRELGFMGSIYWGLNFFMSGSERTERDNGTVNWHESWANEMGGLVVEFCSVLVRYGLRNKGY